MIQPVVTRGSTKSLTEGLSLNGAPVKIILNGINSSETVDTEQVAVQITSDSNPDFSIDISPYVKNDLSVGSSRIDTATLKRKFPQLEPIKPMIYSTAILTYISSQGKTLFELLDQLNSSKVKLAMHRSQFGSQLDGFSVDQFHPHQQWCQRASERTQKILFCQTKCDHGTKLNPSEPTFKPTRARKRISELLVNNKARWYK